MNQWIKVNESRIRELQQVLMENDFRSEYTNAPFNLVEIHKIFSSSISEIKRLQQEIDRLSKENLKLNQDLTAEKDKSGKQ